MPGSDYKVCIFQIIGVSPPLNWHRSIKHLRVSDMKEMFPISQWKLPSASVQAIATSLVTAEFECKKVYTRYLQYNYKQVYIVSKQKERDV